MNRTLLVALCFAAICACSRAPPEVVAYTSVDQVFYDLTSVLVTNEPDIARSARRIIIVRDGSIRTDEPVIERLRADDVLQTLPALED